MDVLANFLVAIAKVLDVILSLYMWIVIARAILSWINLDPRNPLVQLLYRLTDPVLRRIRRWLPLKGFGIDISPIIVILIIIFLRSFVVTSLIDLARSL
jgi:YggT family protein